MNSEKPKEELLYTYYDILEQIKKTYKPTLKNMTKNELINAVVKLATEIAIYKESQKIKNEDVENNKETEE